MKLIVEFLGLSRRLAQIKEGLLKVIEMGTSRTMIRYLALPRIGWLDVCPPGTQFRASLCCRLNVGNGHPGGALGISKKNGQQQLLNFMEAGG